MIGPEVVWVSPCHMSMSPVCACEAVWPRLLPMLLLLCT